MRRAAPGQLDLLNWTPPEPVARFEVEEVRAVSLTGKLSRAIAATLKDCTLPREEIAERMGAYLGRPLSVNALNAYASQAREDHVISVVRFAALLHATQDRRLLEMLAELFGWAVIERRFLTLIDLAAVQEKQDELRRQADALRRTARLEGML